MVVGNAASADWNNALSNAKSVKLEPARTSTAWPGVFGEPELPMLTLSPRINYVAFFLTLRCTNSCDYCLVNQGGPDPCGGEYRPMSPLDWLRAAGRISTREDLPITLQGGEPALSPALPFLADGAGEGTQFDLLTTLPPHAMPTLLAMSIRCFLRQAPYAPMRFTFHPGSDSLPQSIERVTAMIDAGFQVGVYGLDYPDPVLRAQVEQAQELCLSLGLDFRLKEFLGLWRGSLHGTYTYEQAVNAPRTSAVRCRTSELLVAPDGFIHRCHADLYSRRNPVGHILDPSFTMEQLDEFRFCDNFGRCNPCDVKLKTNRQQIFGHTSVEILFDA